VIYRALSVLVRDVEREPERAQVSQVRFVASVIRILRRAPPREPARAEFVVRDDAHETPVVYGSRERMNEPASR
jgi:hypothetical protein